MEKNFENFIKGTTLKRNNCTIIFVSYKALKFLIWSILGYGLFIFACASDICKIKAKYTASLCKVWLIGK